MYISCQLITLEYIVLNRRTKAQFLSSHWIIWKQISLQRYNSLFAICIYRHRNRRAACFKGKLIITCVFAQSPFSHPLPSFPPVLMPPRLWRWWCEKRITSFSAIIWYTLFTSLRPSATNVVRHCWLTTCASGFENLLTLCYPRKQFVRYIIFQGFHYIDFLISVNVTLAGKLLKESMKRNLYILTPLFHCSFWMKLVRLALAHFLLVCTPLHLISTLPSTFAAAVAKVAWVNMTDVQQCSSTTTLPQTKVLCTRHLNCGKSIFRAKILRYTHYRKVDYVSQLMHI